MVCKGAGHATEHSYVIIRQIEEEILGCFVADGGFEDFLQASNGEPLATFVGGRSPEKTPMSCHSFGVTIDKIRQKKTGGDMGAKVAPFFVSRSARSFPSIPECEGQ